MMEVTVDKVKNKLNIRYHGYLYVKQSTGKDTILWRCYRGESVAREPWQPICGWGSHKWCTNTTICWKTTSRNTIATSRNTIATSRNTIATSTTMATSRPDGSLPLSSKTNQLTVGMGKPTGSSPYDVIKSSIDERHRDKFTGSLRKHPPTTNYSCGNTHHFSGSNFWMR